MKGKLKKEFLNKKKSETDSGEEVKVNRTGASIGPPPKQRLLQLTNAFCQTLDTKNLLK